MKVEVRKDYTYEEMPDYSDVVEGAKEIKMTGDETGVVYINDVVYSHKSDVDLRLQIVMPTKFNAPEAKYPCVVFVQGSGWFKQHIYFNVPMLGRLASKGYVCAIVEYRHNEIAKFPAQIVDGKNAVRFMKDNAEQFHVDPENVIIMGDSSGGHTSAMIGLTCRTDLLDDPDSKTSCEVKGCIELYGALDITMECGFPTTENHQKADSPEGLMMGYDISENMEKAKEGCAVSYVNLGCPPMLLLHGTKDRTVFTQHSVDLFRTLKAEGKDAELYLIRGADHGGPAFWSDEVLNIYDEFIKRCIK